MPKRFTDTEKWSDEWFSELESDMKLVWLYLIDNCDHCGIIKRNLKLIRYHTSTTKTQEEIETLLEGRLITFDKDKWFIPKFIKFQYSKGLGGNMPAIVSVRETLDKYNLLQTLKEHLSNSYITVKDKDKDILNYTSKPVREDGFIPPTKQQSIDFFIENYFSEQGALAAWQYYEDLNWYDKDGTAVKNWKLKFRNVWFKDQYRIEKPSDEEIKKITHAEKIKKLYFKNGKYRYNGVESDNFDMFRSKCYMENIDLYNNLK